VVLRVDIELLLHQCNDRVLQRSRDGCLASANDHVDFTADAEIVEVEAGFNCKAGSRQKPPIIVRFVVVHVHAVAVDGLAEAVTGPVQHVISVAGAPQNRRGRAIDLPAAKLLTGRHGALHQRHGGVARRAHRLEGLDVRVGRARPRRVFAVTEAACGAKQCLAALHGRRILRRCLGARCRSRLVLVLLGSAGLNFVMGVPGADDVMLNYQSTSFHDALFLRTTLGLARAPEFEAWLQRMQITDAAGRLLPPAAAHQLAPMSSLAALTS